MTNNTTAQYGSAELSSPVCAKEYRLRADLNFGDSTATGAGFFIQFVRDPNKTVLLGSLNERGYGMVDANTPNNAWSYTFDTYRDYMGNGQWESSDNSFSSYSNVLGANGVPTVNYETRFRYDNLPWRLKGGGWHTVDIYVNEAQRRTQVLRNGVVALDRTDSQHYYRQGEALTPSYAAFTGVANAAFGVRNVRLEIIRPDYCGVGIYPDPLVDDVVRTACGNFDPAVSCPTTCIDATLEPLMLVGKVTLSQLNAIKSRCVLPPAPKDCSVEEDAASKAGYKKGYSDGAASVDLDSVRKTAYDKGYTDGKASVVCEKPKDPVTKTLTEAEVRDLWAGSCDCDSARNHGAYVSCTAQFLNGLSKAGLLEAGLKGTLQAEAAQSSCGKKQEESEPGAETEEEANSESEELESLRKSLSDMTTTLNARDREIERLKKRLKASSKPSRK